MRPSKRVQNGFLVATAAVVVGAHYVPGSDQSGPVLTAAAAIVSGKNAPGLGGVIGDEPSSKVSAALRALSNAVRPLSHPRALETAFRSYFAFKAAHPDQVRKPYLYFVDYGQPSTEPRGYVFDMNALTIVEGPFTVAHGRGSSRSRFGACATARSGRRRSFAATSSSTGAAACSCRSSRSS